MATQLRTIQIFLNSVKKIADWIDKGCQDKDLFPEYTFPISGDFSDSRMKLQRAAFTFHVEKCKKIETPTDYCIKIIIDRDSKKKIRNQLRLVGIDEFSIYGDLDHLSKSLKSLFGDFTVN